MKVVNGNIVCSEIIQENYLEYGEKFYSIAPLSVDDNDGGKGGNSNVFKLIDPDFDDDNYEVIKFCKYPLQTPDLILKTRIDRFKNEIKALKRAKALGSEDIIDIRFNDAKEIDGSEFLYYVMERADSDMLKFMQDTEISLQQKFVLCIDILNGINQLHASGIFHRDIKPDNILFVNNRPKISDLGLIATRDADQDLDSIREKIGPSGWLSPEAVNKMLCEGTRYEMLHCCTIKEYSDVFQLGKLFWYIFEGTAPIGQIQFKNFKLGNRRIFDLIFNMLQYLMTDRPILDFVINEMQDESRQFQS